MVVPQLTVSLAGGTNVGKTTFMHGMYHRLSAGLHDYFLYAIDPDEEIGLLETWQRLQETGEMPRGTGTDPRTYAFRFSKNMTPLLNMTWTDFRGGALHERGDSPEAPGDIALWRTHLRTSDSVYLVLDGQELGRWVRNGTPRTPNINSGGMALAYYNRTIREAREARSASGNPPPSFVVLITKMDMLPVESGMALGPTLRAVVADLEKLLPLLFDSGVTVLVCPVQIGDFRTPHAENRRVDRSLIRPQNLHRPICFSLWHYLAETLAANRQQLAAIEAKLTESDRELAALRARTSFPWRRGKLSSAESEQWTRRTEKTEVETEMAATRNQAERLMREFDRLPLIRDGEVQLPSEPEGDS